MEALKNKAPKTAKIAPPVITFWLRVIRLIRRGRAVPKVIPPIQNIKAWFPANKSLCAGSSTYGSRT